MSIQDRFSATPVPDSQPTATSLFRDRIALRCRQTDVQFPRALDLEADVLEALHRELYGVASALSGVHSPDNWRERLRGERSLPLGDLCRLATDPTREARAAVVAALGSLARAVGYTLQALQAAPGSLVESAIAAANTATRGLGDVTRAIADGQIDAQEAASLRSRATELRHAAMDFEVAVLKAGLRA